MKVQKISYEGKKVFLGIDVHKIKYVIAATCDGVLVKKWTQTACPQSLLNQINKFFLNSEVYTAYEAGFSGFTLHRVLINNGIKNIVVNPGSIEVKSNDRVKTDKRDAKKISAQLYFGSLKGIYVPTPEEEARRAITRGREQVVSRRKRISNQIKMKLHYLGFEIPERQKITKKFIDYILNLYLADEHKFVFEELTNAWIAENESLKKYNKALVEQAKNDKLEKIYRSVPGVGAVSARTLSNEFGDMSRFNNEKEIFSCTGLTPSEYSTGEHIRKGHISRQGIPRIRGLLVEVAWRAITECPNLHKYYDRLKLTRGGKRAIVAVARKMLGRIRKCLNDQTLWLSMEVSS